MFRRRMRKFASPVSDTVRKLRRRFRPTLEILEERRLLSTYVVNSLTDTGSGSVISGDLRYCIGKANADNQADTIVFDPTVFSAPQTIKMAGGTTGAYVVTGNLTIIGPGAGKLTLDAQLGDLNVFYVEANATVTLSGLTLANGNGGNGGDIWNQGDLTMSDCTITGVQELFRHLRRRHLQLRFQHPDAGRLHSRGQLRHRGGGVWHRQCQHDRGDAQQQHYRQ
jgi:hypothetical protein